MKNGTYIYTNQEVWNQGTITIQVKSTDKTLSFTLLENTIRYSPSAIDMLFSKSNAIKINKARSQHSISADYDDWFVMYPYRLGIPFLFERENGI